MSEDRIQKILARAGVASRRAAEELIEAGRVTVNGTVATLGDKADPERDAVKLDGKRIHARTEFHYLLLNKPRAVMSTRQDPEGRPTVMDYVPHGRRKAMVPVGRLDFLTEGLILLTDDGDLAHRVAHPRYGCSKTYEVKVQGRPDDKGLDKLRRGMPIDGKKTVPAVIEPRPVPGESDNSWWTVELSEGRTRQIREMFQRIGHRVMKLRRVAIGPVRDAALPLGAVRELSAAEVEKLRRSTRGGGKAGAGAASGAPEGKGARNVKGGAKRGRSDAGAGSAGRPKGGGKGRAAGRSGGGGRGAERPGGGRGKVAGRSGSSSRGIAGSRIATSGGREGGDRKPGRRASGAKAGGRPGGTRGPGAGGRGTAGPGGKGTAGSRLGTSGGGKKAGGGRKVGGGKKAGGGRTAGGAGKSSAGKSAGKSGRPGGKGRGPDRGGRGGGGR